MSHRDSCRLFGKPAATTYDPGTIQGCTCTVDQTSEYRMRLPQVITLVNNVLSSRIHDLSTCHKEDDCHTLARGVELALDDLLTALLIVDIASQP